MHEPGQTEGQLSAPLALEEGKSARDLLAVGLLSLVVGAGTGVVSGAFRLVLVNADRLRDVFVLWARGQAAGFCLAVLACAAAAVLAAWLVRRFSPCASGSGIPHVESVLREELPPASLILIPIKFFGGVLAIGSGLALGREGPSVQMGASIGNLFGEWFHLGWKNSRVLLAAGAGAGLAAAFNAPVAGAIFVLAELTRELELHTAIAAIGASATAISVSQAMLGTAPDFHVGNWLMSASKPDRCFSCLASSRASPRCFTAKRCSGSMSLAQSLHRRRAGLYAALTGSGGRRGGVAGGDLVGGGDAITQNTLLGTQPLFALLLFSFSALASARFPTPPRRRGNIRANARFGRAARVDLWANLSVDLSGPRASARGLRRGRYGGVLYRRRSRAAHRNCPCDGNDRQCGAAAADARGLLRRNARAKPAALRPNLRSCASWRWSSASKRRLKAFAPPTSRPRRRERGAVSREFCRCSAFADNFRPRAKRAAMSQAAPPPTPAPVVVEIRRGALCRDPSRGFFARG